MNKHLKTTYLFLLSSSLVAAQTTDDSPVVSMGNAQTTAFRQTQAIATIYADELDKNSTQNPYNALFGLLPGLNLTQNTNWGSNPGLMIRGRGSLTGASPLIVVDGFPRPIEFLNLTEIESVSVLKDGAATALWGARGANGVILVTTKRGKNHKLEVGVDYTFGMGLPINQPEFANSYEYAMARNEALYYDGLDPFYSEQDLAHFRDGTGDPDLYPNTDWLKEGTRDYTTNHQLDVTLQGGNNRVRYYSVLSYKNDQGILNNDYTQSERYNSQIKRYDLNLRVNLDADLTPTTQVRLNMLGMLRENVRPRTAISDIFSNLYKVPAAAFPVKTQSDNWGSNDVYKMNPIAQIADVGYYKENQRMLQADIRVVQDLKAITPGLFAELAVAYDNNAKFRETGSKNYIYETNHLLLNQETGEYEKVSTTYGENSVLNITNGGLADQYMRSGIDAKIGYERWFSKHHLNLWGMFRQESLVPMGRNKTRKRQYMVANVGYNYNNRYFLDALINHYGSSVLSTGDKYRNYPAVSGAWVISNESFMQNEKINLMKLRASWGRSGWDGIDYELDRQFWDQGGTYYFGDANNSFWGASEGRLPMKQVDLEIADKYNVGFDMMLFDRLSMSVDGFYDHRTQILIDGSGLISSAIGVGVPKLNEGEVKTKGGELSLTWQENKKTFNYYIGGNISFAQTEIIENGEGFQPWNYLSKIGHSVGQMFGLEADGYFDDEQEIAESPVHSFSEVRPGDIKYKDQNGDNVIDKYDVVAIGHSETPEVYYGINMGFEYKGFGVDLLFQGTARSSKMLNTANVFWPMRNNTNVSTWYLEDRVRWTEETKATANVPRLTTLENANNFRNSTQWLVDGSYFKLRNANVYYNFPKSMTQKMHIEACQVFLRGNNLFSIDQIDYANAENIGINYPDLMSLFVGVNLKF